MLITAISGFCVLLLLAAAFGAASARVRRTLGRRAVVALWLGAAALVAAAGTIRSIALQRDFSYQPARYHPLWTFGFFAAFLLVALAPSMLSLTRGIERSPSSGAIRALILIWPGLVIAMMLLLALDLGGIEFLPPR